jgi:elongation factor G
VPKVDLKFAKQTGGHGQVCACGHRDGSRRRRARGIVFENNVVGGRIPKEFINPTEKGIREAAESGIVGGYPVVRHRRQPCMTLSRTTSTRTKWRSRRPARWPSKKACSAAERFCRNRSMKVEVIVPEEFMGDVLGDLAGRRAAIEGMEPRANVQVIRASVPLAEMFGYATDLRSATQGRGIYTMEFHHYQQLPQALAEEALKGNSNGGRRR